MIVGWPSPTFSATVDLKPHAALVALTESEERESAVSLNQDRPWRRYVESLRQPAGTFSAAHVQAVFRFWHSARQALGQIVSLPLTQPAVDGAIQMAWEKGPHYLEVDVYPDSMVEWFYRNRDTKELDGTDDIRVSGLAQPLLTRMKQALA